MNRLFAAALALFAWVSPAPSSAEVAAELRYCYESQCFDNEPAAVAAMRAAHPRGGLLEKKSTQAVGYSEESVDLAQRYYVPDQHPESITEPYFNVGGTEGVPAGWCAPSDGPDGAHHCRTEGEAVNGLYNFIVDHPDNTECTWGSTSYRNEHAVPFFYVDGDGRISYVPNDPEERKEFLYSADCGGGPSEYFWQISKWAYATCPAGFYSRTGYAPQHAVEGYETVILEELCRSALDEPVIYTTVRQIACENGNCNPTYPGTGDKARFEPDLEFAGRTFMRSYHSLGQGNPQVEMAPNWQHSYTDRVLVGASTMELIVQDERGYFDYYTYVSSSVSRSVSNPDRVLRTLSDRYRLIDENGEVKEFSLNDGKLLRVYHPNDPGRKVELTYDAYHTDRLVKLTDAHRRTLTLLYTDTGRLAGVQTIEGAEVLYDYDAQGNLAEVLYPDGSTRTYHYAETGLALPGYPHLLTGITDENGDRYANFGYDAQGRTILSELLTGDTGSPSHDRTTLVYSSETTVELTRGTGDGVSYTLSSDRMRRTLSRVDGHGDRARTYDTSNRLSQTTDASGVVSQFGYATTYTNSIKEAVGTPNERRTQLVRNTWQQLTSSIVQRKQGSSYLSEAKATAAYDGNGRITASCEIDPTSAAVNYSCGSAADAPAGVRQTRIVRCTAAEANAANSTCPILGLVKSVDGPRAGSTDTTSYSYRSADDVSGCATNGPCHRKGDLHVVTAPGGLTMTYVRYDLAGRPTRVLDANNVATDLEYDLRGRLSARKVRGADDGTEADDAITRLEYDNVGQVTKVIQPDGAFVEFTYDHAHRLTGLEDNLGNTVTYSLDGAGNRIAEETRDAGSVLRHSLARVYDQLGQLETLADALSTPTDFTYDAAGNVDTVTDAFNRTTDNDYDPLGRLKRSIANVGGTGSERAETQFQYDALDNLAAVIDPKGLTTDYDYNGLGDLVTLTSPDTGSTTYTYDSAGNRSGQLDARGVQSNYSYDALNRLTAIDLPTVGQDIGFTYDNAPTACTTGETFAAGRLSGFTDPSGSTAYCYDRRGNVVRKMQSVTGAPAATVGYTHSAADRLLAMTYPSGAVVTYLRDSTGRITGVTAKPTASASPVTVVSDVDYLPFGPATLMTFGNGRTLDRSYDQNYGIAGISDSAVDGVDLDYTLDAVGNVTGLAERTAGGSTTSRTVEYDELDRLTALKNGATTVQGFTYDATGNRTGKTAGTTEAYTYPGTSHRLTQTGTTARSHDAAGNTTAIGASRVFAYDDRGRMSQFTQSGVLTREYAYNARGERVAKRNPTVTGGDLHYVYDEAGRLLGEYDQAGARIKEYVWLDDTLVAVLGPHSGSDYQYVLTDHLGTPRAVVHPGSNAILWRWDLTGSAFGDHAAQSDPDGDSVAYTFNLRYPGQYYDAETGLHYNYFRDYDPSTGRYVQSDPIGLAGGSSTYGYVSGSPYNFIDALGLLQYTVNQPAVDYNFADGQINPLYPGDSRRYPAASSTLGRTTITWGSSAKCECVTCPH